MSITVPHLDKEQVAAEAAARVAAVVDAHPGDDIDSLVERLGAISHLANAQQERANTDRALRDELALSLALHDGVRAVQNALGVNRNRFYEMRCDALGLTGEDRKAKWLEPRDGETHDQRLARIAARAADAGVKRYPPLNMKWLLEIATSVATADTAAAMARDIRDQMVLELLERGWVRREIAAVIGRSVTRISRIQSKTHAA